MKNDEKYANNKVNDKYFRSVHHLNLLNLFKQINFHENLLLIRVIRVLENLLE